MELKKLDRLILKSFLGPLALTFAISVFVLLMQFVWKYIDDMVGKGLDIGVIVELLLYASATFVPMALPIAVLFASIMTMGNFGEKYELVAMKAGGVSLTRIMMPLTLVALLLTGVAFVFANDVMPKAVLKYKQTLFDITRKKPALNIRPSEYYSDIDGYVIRVNEKDANDGQLHDIMIYDHSHGMSQTNVVVADNGYMQTSPDDRYLIFTLNNGYTYTESMEGGDAENSPFLRIKFDQQVLTFDISSFAYSESNDDFFKGNYQMMNVIQLDTTIAALHNTVHNKSKEFAQAIFFKLMSMNKYKEMADHVTPKAGVSISGCLDTLSLEERQRVYAHAHTMASSSLQEIEMYGSSLKDEDEFINRHYVEWQRKYTLSLACLLLFLIGAPFGSIVRKGGLGMPLVASVVFFVMYYVIGMISEKAVREGAIGPIGMWISTFAFLPIGMLLTFQATTDSSLFDLATWRKWLKKLGRCFVARRKSPTVNK